MTAEKSTNVRIHAKEARLAHPLLRMGFATASAIAPSLAGRWAAHLFVKAPPRHGTPARARAIVAQGMPIEIALRRGKLAAMRWGSGPVVVLLHGWGGRGSQLYAFVEPLVRAGFGVVAFDGPAHGASDGRKSSLPAFARALAAVIDAVGPVHAVVAHSMGAAACMLAVNRGAQVPRAVFLAPPASAHAFFEKFAAYVGLPGEAARAAEARIEQNLHTRWSELEARAMSPAAAAKVPLLVFHDEDDADVAWSEGATVAAAWPGAELVTTKGLGHHRILRDPNVVSGVVRFLARGEPVPCRCEQCELERELFDRSLRAQPRTASATRSAVAFASRMPFR